MTQPGPDPSGADVTDRIARGGGPARMLAFAAAGLAVLFYLLGFLGDVGIATGDVGILLIGGGLLVGASGLPRVGRVLLPGAVAVVVGMLVLLQVVASGGSSGLLVGALVVAFLEAFAAVTAFLLDLGVVTPPAPRVRPPRSGLPGVSATGPLSPGVGAWPGPARGRPGAGPGAWPPGAPPAPGQLGPPGGGPGYGYPPAPHPSQAGRPAAWLPPMADPSVTAAYERPFGPTGGQPQSGEVTAVFALPPPGATAGNAGLGPGGVGSAFDPGTPPGWGRPDMAPLPGPGAPEPGTSPAAGRDTARIGTPVTPAWGQPAVERTDSAGPVSSGPAGSGATAGSGGRPEQDGTDGDGARSGPPGERPDN